MKQRRLTGYTLVELLAGITLFSGVLATMLSVTSSLRNTERFRDENSVVTQAANFAFEPIIRSLRSSDAVETYYNPLNGQCTSVRGFYMIDQNGTFQPDVSLGSAGIDVAPFALNTHKLVTVDTEKYQDPMTGPSVRWVKKEYQLANNDPDEKGNAYPTIIETTYHALASYTWPQPLSCTPTNLHWDTTPGNVTRRALTSNRALISRFAIRIAAARVNEANPTLRTSPFITLELTAQNATSPTVPMVTLRSTVTPTFSYGDQSD